MPPVFTIGIAKPKATESVITTNFTHEQLKDTMEFASDYKSTIGTLAWNNLKSVLDPNNKTGLVKSIVNLRMCINFRALVHNQQLHYTTYIAQL